MPATIVQRNKKPFKKVKVDTVTIDIIESALRKIELARKWIEASGKDIRLEVDGGVAADQQIVRAR